MKWGQRKDKKSSGSKSSRKKYRSHDFYDIYKYGRRGADRIEKRVREKGMSRNKARRRESGRRLLVNTSVTLGIAFAKNPKLSKALGQSVAAAAGTATGTAYKNTVGKVVNSFGGYSYKNAAKYVAMNVKNKARGVSYL